MKPSILMLAAHEPTLDPRIDWEASAAAPDFDVTVIGLETPGLGRSLHPTGGSPGHPYAIERLDREPPASRGRFVWLSARLLLRPAWLWAAVGGVAALLAPVLLVIEIALRVLAQAFNTLIRPALARAWTVRLLRSLVTRRGEVGNATMTGRARFRFYVRHIVQSGTAFFDAIERRADKPDIIHCNDLDTLLPGVLAARHFGCRVLYDSHEFWPEADLHAPWYQVAALKWLERRLIRRADAVVTVSPPLARELERTYDITGVESLPNAQPWTGDPPPRDPALANGAVRFLYQGNFAPGRGIDELIAAWRRMPDERALLLLRGPDNPEKERCRKLARDAGILDRTVLFPEAVTEDLLVAAASEADVGIIPYKPHSPAYRYCCPNKLSQYLHAGLPVISNDLPFVKEILARGSCGLAYDSGDEASMVEVFTRMADDADLRRRCRDHGLAFARSEFNWNVLAERQIALYERLLVDQGHRA